MEHRLEHVWYREKPQTESTHADPFIRERGTLIVEDDAARFEGPRTQLVLRGIEMIDYGVHGAMTNPTVQVRYRDDDGQVRKAWFNDGRLGGYMGAFGGTRQLAQALSHLALTSYGDEAAGRSQRRLALILGLLVLVFLARALRSYLQNS